MATSPFQLGQDERLSIGDFAARLRKQAGPSQYDAWPDDILVGKFLEKNPTYRDKVNLIPILPPPGQLPQPIAGQPSGQDDGFLRRTGRLMAIKAGDIARGAVTPAPVALAEAGYEKAKTLGKRVKAEVMGEPPPPPTPLTEEAASLVGINPEAIREGTTASGSLFNPDVVTEGLTAILTTILGGRAMGKKFGRIGAEPTPLRPGATGAAADRLSFAGSKTATPGLATAYKSVLPELVETIKATGPVKPGLVDLPNIIEVTQQRLSQQFKGYLNEPVQIGNQPGRLGDFVVSGDVIAQALDREVTPAIVKAHPEMAEAITKRADQFRGQRFSLDELNEVRQIENAALDPYFSKNPVAQAVAAQQPQAARLISRTVRNTATDVLYAELEQRSTQAQASAGKGTPLRALKKKEKALIDIKDAQHERIETLEAEIARQRGMPWEHRLGATESVNVNPTNPMGSARMRVGSAMDLIRPAAERELKAANKATRKALGRRPRYGTAALATGVLTPPPPPGDFR